MPSQNNVSPLRYPGGKTRACKIIDKTVSEYFCLNDYDTLISPFFGGGSFEFYCQKFKPLYSFWNQIKTNKNELCLKLYKVNNVSKEQFTNYRKTIMTLDDPLQQSFQYFILNRCSFSGATLSGGFSDEASKKRFTSSSIKRAHNLDLSNVDIRNQDFSEFICGVTPREKTIVFLDPPYFLNSKLYGMNGDIHDTFDHLKLFKTITSLKSDWILTYNNCDYIKTLYKDYKIINVEWSYGMNSSKDSSEIIIMGIRVKNDISNVCNEKMLSFNIGLCVNNIVDNTIDCFIDKIIKVYPEIDKTKLVKLWKTPIVKNVGGCAPKEGKRYELQVYDICKNCNLNNKYNLPHNLIYN